MGWIERAFGRAIIYNVVREGLRGHRSYGTQVVRRARPQDHEVVVAFVCRNGHEFTVTFDDGRMPTEGELRSAECPACGTTGKPLTLDYHVEYH